MAAYAALVSVVHIIDQIHNHPRPSISLDKKQLESLSENVNFLLDFMECYSHVGIKEAAEGGLEGRIVDAAYAAEDVIESSIVDQILSGSTNQAENISSADLYQALQKVIQDMEFIKNDVVEIYKGNKTGPIQDKLDPVASSSTSPLSTGKSIIVGLDDVLTEILNKLTGHQSARIIPIVGMGGIGKTTLARNVYVNPLTVQYFDILAWATISQEFSMKQILVDMLLCLSTRESREKLSRISEDELGEKLYKSLSGRRYLIVVDDLWSIEAWRTVKIFFPNNNKESRIILTTRLSNVAFQIVDPHHGVEMELLSEDKSWDLLCKSVFGDQKCCPVELEKIGKKIAKNCKGLPLSIVVIGGLLAKSKQSQQYWEYIAENLTSVVNPEDHERCLQILQTSYTQLPVHLKPCFMYMGVFPADNVIRVSWLIKLWVAEGFLRPNNEKNLEMVAQEYFKELTDRNLILVHNRGSTGKIKSCNIHDLLRDLCLKQAQKEKFLRVTRDQDFHIPHGINTLRRIGIHANTGPGVLDAMQSESLVRSLICNVDGGLPLLNNFRLLRVFKAHDHQYENGYLQESIFQLVNSRFLDIGVGYAQKFRFPSSFYIFWNLQTLIVKRHSYDVTAPPEIWNMPQLRHVHLDSLELPDPPNGDDLVLQNMQTLSKIQNFKCSEEVVKRIPNIQKLKIWYASLREMSWYCVNNFGRLQKLESFGCFFVPENEPSIREMMLNMTFPQSLKKLSLEFSSLLWEDMTATKIGSLPRLEVLKLRAFSFVGPEWETVEGEFLRLKFLLIDLCDDLEYWTTDSTHFPCLEHLVLLYLDKLSEIPSSIGDIPTLQSIELICCSYSSVISAKKILDEQEHLGNVGLQVRVVLSEENQVLENLASPNFQVEIRSIKFETNDNEDDNLDEEEGDEDDEYVEDEDEDEDDEEAKCKKESSGERQQGDLHARSCVLQKLSLED